MEEWMLGWAIGVKYIQDNVEAPAYWHRRFSAAFAEGYEAGRAAGVNVAIDLWRAEGY